MSKKRTKEEWRQLLTPEKALKYSIDELASLFNVHRSTIIKIKKDLGLKGIRRRHLQTDWKKVFRTYNPLLYTSKEIAGKINKHPVTVRRALSKLGYTRNSELRYFLTKKRLKLYTLKELAADTGLTPNGVSKAITRLYRKNSTYRKPRVIEV